jgi:hypothetical protein
MYIANSIYCKPYEKFGISGIFTVHLCIRLLALIIFTLLLIRSPISYAESEANATLNSDTLYFYNSETNINNYVSLKIAFDTYLSKFGTFRFQPFSDKEIFEKTLVEKQDGGFLLSSWHYRILQKKVPITPVLVGVSHGKSTQRKVLSAKKQINEVELLKGGKIASASNEAYTRTILNQILGKKSAEILAQVKLILVPKDIDALMAVGFGMADAALTTEDSLDDLAKINQKQFSMLTRLGASEKQFLTLAVVPKKTSVNTAVLLEILEDMSKAPEGESRLRMLGLNGWRKLTQSELKELDP